MVPHRRYNFVYNPNAVLVSMRYAVEKVSGSARRIFKDGTVYDDRQIVTRAGRVGFTVTRPNRSRHIRGSSRLVVWDGSDQVARFVRYDDPGVQSGVPTPVGTIRGRLL